MRDNESALEMCLRHKKEREDLEKMCEPEILTQVRKIHEEEEPGFDQNEVIRKAATGTLGDDEYQEYKQIQKSGRADLYTEAQVEVRKCIEEFNDIASRTISKANETDIQLEARIWSEHPDLYERLSTAQSTLAHLQKAGR
jgi:hypothetical protein